MYLFLGFHVVPACLSAERPQYYEIYKHRAVLGISLPFMFIDILGGVFSILSLVFKRHLDVLAALAYALVVVRPSGQRLPATGHSSYHVTYLAD